MSPLRPPHSISGEETAGGDQARRCGRFGLWGFDGGRMVGVGCEICWSARTWAEAPPAAVDLRRLCGGAARVWLGQVGARGGLEPSATAAGVGGRHGSRFSAAVMVTLCRPFPVAGRAALGLVVSVRARCRDAGNRVYQWPAWGPVTPSRSRYEPEPRFGRPHCWREGTYRDRSEVDVRPSR